MRPLLKKILAALLLLILALVPSVGAMGRAAAKRTVTVGVYSFGDYMDLKPDGRHRGYCFEYLYEIAKYSGWNFKFIDYDTFDECYEALRQGKIDILPAVFWSR
jgi:ABC-type amino acid transport substrate-binding protein